MSDLLEPIPGETAEPKERWQVDQTIASHQRGQHSAREVTLLPVERQPCVDGRSEPRPSPRLSETTR